MTKCEFIQNLKDRFGVRKISSPSERRVAPADLPRMHDVSTPEPVELAVLIRDPFEERSWMYTKGGISVIFSSSYTMLCRRRCLLEIVGSLNVKRLWYLALGTPPW